MEVMRVKKGFSEKTLPQKQKNKIDGNKVVKKNRFLITVNVPGSAGPLRFVVNEDDRVAGVIDMALKQYAHQGRLPLLGSDTNNFLLYPTSSGPEALSASDLIGMCGVRNFMLCKKQRQPHMSEGKAQEIDQKGKSSWKTWLNKSFALKIYSHRIISHQGSSTAR